jgi:hypothetical protein
MLSTSSWPGDVPAGGVQRCRNKMAYASPKPLTPPAVVAVKLFAECENTQLTASFAFCEDETNATDIPPAVEAVLGKIS